jgi:hypothetical protein
MSNIITNLSNYTLKVLENIISPSHDYYKKLLDIATTYDQWRAAAIQLDSIENKDIWKEELKSNDYDYGLISKRLQELKKAKESGDLHLMIFVLRTELSRNMGNMGNPNLYTNCRVGTKKLIEEYISEVVSVLNIVADNEEISLLDRMDLFGNMNKVFGRTALLLSGGATLGLYHIGVIKALHEAKLLPRIISGSSVGGLIAATVCCKTEDELSNIFNYQNINLNGMERPDEVGNIFVKIARFINNGVVCDIDVLKECIRGNTGDLTFSEA